MDYMKINTRVQVPMLFGQIVTYNSIVVLLFLLYTINIEYMRIMDKQPNNNRYRKGGSTGRLVLSAKRKKRTAANLSEWRNKMRQAIEEQKKQQILDANSNTVSHAQYQINKEEISMKGVQSSELGLPFNDTGSGSHETDFTQELDENYICGKNNVVFVKEKIKTEEYDEIPISEETSFPYKSIQDTSEEIQCSPTTLINKEEISMKGVQSSELGLPFNDTASGSHETDFSQKLDENYICGKNNVVLVKEEIKTEEYDELPISEETSVPYKSIQDTSEEIQCSPTTSEKKVVRSFQFCKPCMETFFHLDTYQNHLNSRKHKMKVKTQAYDEANDVSSSNRMLTETQAENNFSSKKLYAGFKCKWCKKIFPTKNAFRTHSKSLQHIAKVKASGDDKCKFFSAKRPRKLRGNIDKGDLKMNNELISSLLVRVSVLERRVIILEMQASDRPVTRKCTDAIKKSHIAANSLSEKSTNTVSMSVESTNNISLPEQTTSTTLVSDHLACKKSIRHQSTNT